jgi:hypothetical protein
MFTVQFKGVKELQRDLETAQRKALPYAMRNALTTTAFEARRIWQNEMKAEFTLRNQYTQRSVIAKKASGSGNTLQSSVGSFAEYMGDQEEGAIVRGRTGLKGIPGPVAAGLAPGAKRTRVVRAAARLGALHVVKPTGRSKAQTNAMAIRIAIQRGSKVALLERPGGGKGLFRVSGGRRRFTGKRFTQRKVKVALLWDFSRHAVRVPGSHTLARTLKALQPKLEHIHTAALVEQLRRYRVFGY